MATVDKTEPVAPATVGLFVVGVLALVYLFVDRKETNPTLSGADDDSSALDTEEAEDAEAEDEDADNSIDL